LSSPAFASTCHASMSYTRLRYHIVTATQDRHPLITPEVEAVLYPALYRKAQDCGGRLLAVGGVADHIHLVAALPPTIALADFIRAVKARASRVVNKAGFYGGQFRWQRGYGAFTLDPFDLARVLAYVSHQKQ